MVDDRVLRSWLALAVWIVLSYFANAQEENFRPRFRNRTSDFLVQVPENAPVGHVVCRFEISDAEGDPLNFTVSSLDAPFEFDLNSLQTTNTSAPIIEYFIDIVVSGRLPGLDYETRKELNVTLQVSDKQHTSTSTLFVKVLNVNDNKPNLNVSQDSVSINEESPIGTPLNFVMAFWDVDFPNSAYVGLQGDDARVMNVDPMTGNISLNTVIDIDPNTPSKVLKPVLFASDGTFTTTTTLTLTVTDINDNPPVCNLQTYLAEVTEAEQGSRVVATLNCSDRDSSFNDNNKLIYTIVQGNQSMFGISSSGEFSVLSPLDYEKVKYETVVLRVEDDAIGSPHLSTTVTVSVMIKPANDIWPEWGTWTPVLPPDMTYFIYENASLGTSVFTASATDADLDKGNVITYSMITSVAGGILPANVFNMDPITGLVTTKSSLDRDGPYGISGYTATVQASDGGVGGHVINKTVNLVVLDVNDNAPKFENLPLPVITLQEEMARAGAVVTKVSASDLDSISVGLTYDVSGVLSGNTSLAVWKFNTAVQGQLELAADLDLDIDNPPSPVQVLELKVRDNGFPELTGTATLTVSLVPDNEFSPTILAQPGAVPVQVPENVPVNTPFTQVVGHDRDKGPEGKLIYSIIGGNVKQAFSIDSEGKISSRSVLNRDTVSLYELTVSISDSGTNVKSVTTSVTIEVTNVNNSLICSPDNQSVNIPEDSKVNTVVAFITCTHVSTNIVVTSTVKSPVNSPFGFSASKSLSSTSSSHELILLGVVDYDSSTQSYLVEIELSDGKNVFPVKVAVTVTAVNEASPVFQSNATVSVPENSVQNPLLKYSATDQDYSPHDIISYIIGSVSNGGSPLFNIDHKSASLSLVSPLDYEALPGGDKTYKIVVVAEDGGGLKGTGTVTVLVTNINDNSPTCAQLQFFIDVSEVQSGTAPYNILRDLGCSDLEDGKNLTYSMTQTPGDHFSITNGSIQLKSNSLDYETSTKHTLTIRVIDSGQPPQTSTVTAHINVLGVNEGGPLFSVTYPVNISESAQIGQFVADVTATDPDGSVLEYSITGGDTDQQFTIDSVTGQIATRRRLDFESVSSYRLTVQARERSGTNLATTVQIVNVVDINDEMPVCAVTNFVLIVPESEPVNHTVTDLACVDRDVGTVLTYSILSGNTTLFKMEGSKLKLIGQLDFEQPPLTHKVDVLVSDLDVNHDVTVSGTIITGSVDEGPPKFSNDTYVIRIWENAAVNSIVFTLTAVDPDSPLDDNGQVKYSFIGPHTLFSLDTLSGQIILTSQLDREKQATYNLVVKADDALGSNTATVSVIVDDINDNSPNFRSLVYRSVVSDVPLIGTSILKVEATDADDPNFNSYGAVLYQIAGGSPDFRINETSGVISNTVPLDARNGSRIYTLNVTAIDSGGGPGALTGTCVVTIHVTTVNLYAPVCDQSTYNMTVQENQFNTGDILLNVSAKDEDGGPDGEVTMRLLSSQGKFYLTQNKFTGEVHLQQDLDFDTGDTAFVFDIIITDKGSPPMSGTCTVVIIVDDLNDNPPLCTPTIILDKVEGETTLTQMVCPNLDPNTALTYFVMSTSPASTQPSVSVSGLVTTSPALDYETSPKYDILVQVSNNKIPAVASDVTIKLFVADLNDNDPTFRGPLTFDLQEKTLGGNKVLYTVLADGNDGPADNVTYSLSDNTYLHITPDTGNIILINTAPDFETIGGLYVTQVCIHDTPNPTARTACSNISVNIKDVNDELPQFSQSSYPVSVPEDAAPGKTLLTVTVVDRDASPEFRNITYSIAAGNLEGSFRILPSGDLELMKKLDFARTPTYTLVIEATDGPHKTSAQCHIKVEQVNEFAPTFPAPSVTVHVEENAPSKTFVYKAEAIDSDSGADGQVRYSIDSGPFMIDSLSGEVSVIGSLDRETTPVYILTVKAVDLATIPKAGTLQLTIIVDDANDHAPDCGPNLYTTSVKESVMPGDVVAPLTCVDDDNDPSGLNNATSYNISSIQDKFIIDQSGRIMIRTGVTLDREMESFYTLIVTVTDQGVKQKLTTTVTIDLTVLDVNDNSPYFTSLMPISVSEDTQPGATLGMVKSEDKDEGVNSQLVYAIIIGDAGNHFSLDPNNGSLALRKSLDYETEQQYELLITVRDRGFPARSVNGTLTVTVSDVNDNPPVCVTSMYSVKLLENSTNEHVATITCDDVDKTGLVTYSITHGSDGNFTINATTGIVTTQVGARLDFETVKFYTLKVVGFDGIYSDTVDITVEIQDVNEFAPEFTTPGSVSVMVPEDTGINSLVYEFKAIDKDTADTVKVFSIAGGNSRQMFTLGSQTGRLQLQKALDYESETYYILSVMVEDSGGLRGTTEILINVTDVNDNSPTCIDKSVTVTILEGATSSNVYTPSCHDADKVASPVLFYSLPDASHPAFAINNNTGQLSIVVPLDYEVETAVGMRIMVREKGIPSPRETSIDVRVIVSPVNEHAPVFQPSNIYGPYSIPEDAVTGTVVAQVTASDLDKGPSDSIVRFIISDGDPDQYFRIDEISGEIQIIRKFNRKIIATYTLSITATDSLPGSNISRSATATVTLIITDVNDHSPRLVPPLYWLNVSETSQPSVVLVHLNVEDEDEGNNSATSIAITRGNAENKFAISGKDLILSGPLDYETTSFYDLFLEITDAGHPPLRSSGQVSVKVLPVNEEAPRMEAASATITIPENSQPGALVFHANATDIDSETHGQITYSIDGNGPKEFIINPATGQLYVNAPLDYDTPPNSYKFIIRATDGAGASDTVASTMSLIINLSDVNDHVPKFSSSVVVMKVVENVQAGTEVGSVLATDQDSGLNGQVTYNQTGGTGDKYFTVDHASGVVTTAGAIDYEMYQVYYVSVMAYDGGTPSFNSNCLIKVEVTNINDNIPVIIPQNFEVAIQSTFAVGDTVIIYSADDADTDIGGFSLVSSSKNFVVDEARGIVKTTAPLDMESAEIYIMYIEVKDMGTEADSTIHTATATLTVFVKDSNISIPVISISVPENISSGDIIARINTTDSGSSQKGNFTYFITSGNIGDAFSINSQGFVQVAKSLDRETVPFYSLNVQITDQGTPPHLSQTKVYIVVMDVNDCEPVYMQQSYEFTVAENSSMGTPIGDVKATDADIGANAQITYMFETFSVGQTSHFSLHPSTGVVTVATSKLNKKLIPSYTTRVKAVDAGSPAKSGFAKVRIIVSDGDSLGPVFLQSNYFANLDEETEPGTHVVSVTAQGTGLRVGDRVSYLMDTNVLDGPTAQAYFQINRTSGDISTIASVDYEKTYHLFTFVVIAVSNDSPSSSGTTTVVITINDINDNNPAFSQSFYNTEVANTGECSNIITMVHATDADSGDNGAVSYLLQAGADSNLFGVTASTGEVTLTNTATPWAIYKLSIQAIDAGNPVRTSVLPAKLRVDPFVPSEVVVTVKLGISRVAFMEKQNKFFDDLEREIHIKYPSAVARLWCVVEYEGTVMTPVSSRRRLLADMPVDVRVYALRDNSTDSEDNIDKAKDFIHQDELVDLTANITRGPNDKGQGGTKWEYVNIISITPYNDDPEIWLGSSYGRIITAFAILLGLILLGLLLFMLLRYCCPSAGKSRKRKETLKVLSLEKLTPQSLFIVEPAAVKAGYEAVPKNVSDSGSKVSFQDMDSYLGMYPPNKYYIPDMFPDILPELLPDQYYSKSSKDTVINQGMEEQSASSVTISSAPSTIRGPRALFITPNKEDLLDDFKVYDGLAYNSVTGNLYEYSSDTRERQWLD